MPASVLATETWDRSGCVEVGCYCHDPSVVAHYCPHCGCRPVHMVPPEPRVRDEQVHEYLKVVREYRTATGEVARVFKILASLRGQMSAMQLESARYVLRSQTNG